MDKNESRPLFIIGAFHVCGPHSVIDELRALGINVAKTE
jgi:uncharacterized protein YbaP (TraB family)